MSRSFTHGKNLSRYVRNAHRYWWSCEPKWWRKIAKHTPQRAKARYCAYCVLHGNEYVLWPLDKKPWEYYW